MQKMKKRVEQNIYMSVFLLGMFPSLINGYIYSKVLDYPLIYWSLEFINWIIIPIALLLFVKKHTTLRLSDIGLNRMIFGKPGTFLIIFFSVIVAPIDFFLYNEFFTLAVEHFSSNTLFSYQSVIPDTPILKIVVVLYFATTASFVEEILYRGLLFKIAQYYANPKLLFLLISPLFFAVIHWETGTAHVVAVYFLGLLMALLYLTFRNLWPLIFSHFFANVVIYTLAS
jgi:membrane protease YdiL (CAAX protease family)